MEAARRESCGACDARGAAEAFLAGLGDDSFALSGVAVGGADLVTVTVTGSAQDVIPGPWDVRVTVAGPREVPFP